MKKLTLKIAFILTADETAFLSTLPVNEPTTKLSTIQLRQLGNIYYRVLGSHHNSMGIMSAALAKKWPGGERKKAHEAQRDILKMLTDLRTMAATIEEKPLDTLLGTIILGDPLQIAVAGAALHIVEGPKQQERNLWMIDVIVNGTPVQLEYMAKIGHEKAYNLAFPGKEYNPNATVSVSFNKVPGYSPAEPMILPPGSETDYTCAMPLVEVTVTESTPGPQA